MNPAAVLVPLLVAGVGFVVYCLIDLARADEVRNLPRWLWAILCLNVAGGVAYLAAGRVRTAHEYERGRRTALDTIATAGYLIWPALGDPTVPGFDLQRWAESQQIAVRDAAAQSGTFRLPAWFTPLADDLGRLLDPVGYDRWWFTPTAPFVRGYQAGLAEARQAAVRAHDGGGSRD